jgi:uncharacterized hydrophobic protein (TIGR00271 family)
MSTKVNPSQFSETVRHSIRVNGELDGTYVAMNTLATMIACYGLFENSPAVIIGAMIVAMLIGPIAAVGLALVDSDTPLLRKSLMALAGGVCGVMLTAFILGWLHRDVPITDEIMARTAPNFMDLMIALAGGAAGAVACITPRISMAFVGVAIATALVPPLSSASLLLARGEYRLAGGAFLLAFANMVAIQFAFSAVLWLNGFRRVSTLGRLQLGTFLKRNAVSVALLIALAALLASNLNRLIANEVFKSSVDGVLGETINRWPGTYLADVRLDRVGRDSVVLAVVRGPRPPNPHEIAALESRLPLSPNGTKAQLRIRFVETLIIDRDGEVTDAGKAAQSTKGTL